MYHLKGRNNSFPSGLWAVLFVVTAFLNTSSVLTAQTKNSQKKSSSQSKAGAQSKSSSKQSEKAGTTNNDANKSATKQGNSSSGAVNSTVNTVTVPQSSAPQATAPQSGENLGPSAQSVALVKPSAPLPRSAKRPKKPLTYKSEELLMRTSTGLIFGTLLVPTTATTTASVPVLFIMHTSTVYDRDGVSNYRSDSSNHFKYLAEALAAEGIAVFRYDVRGSGKSKNAFVNEAFHDFDRSLRDANAWIDTLRKDKRLGNLTVLGFSRAADFGREGGLAGIVVAEQKSADGLILVAPQSQRWLQYLRTQAYALYAPETAHDIDSVAKLMENGLRPQMTGKEGAIYDWMRPSLQPYILSLNKYDPLVEIGKLTIPIIALHGTLDLTTPEETVKKVVVANPNAKFFSVKNMSFNLKDGNADLSTMPREKYKVPIMPEVVDLFANFIYSVEKKLIVEEKPPTQPTTTENK